jgi:plastocyanin domain-containing protein
MKQATLLLLCLLDVFPSCGKRSRPEPPQVAAGTPQSPRRVEVQVSNQGFVPSTVSGARGESVKLVFRYDPSAGECGREVVLPSQNIRVTLTEKEPVEIALTLPQDRGTVQFTCGMNMLQGRIVVQ